MQMKSIYNNQPETDRRKKAFIYTLAICGGLLLLTILISWRNSPPPPLPELELIEINLGNNEDGFGEEQPLIKGERGPSQERIESDEASYSRETAEEKVIPDDNADEEAAVVNRPVKASPNTKPAPVASNVETKPKPQKPKFAYDGPGKGTGNNDTEDNGYRYQGNTQGGKGDAGDPSGHPDSYGNSPGGKIGSGPRVVGNRKIIRHYAFTGDLKKATIYAIVKVSPSGTGSFQGFDKGSTSRSEAYAQAIRNYLRNIQFDKSDKESTVQVQFNFNES